jgi:hypothetical protein
MLPQALRRISSLWSRVNDDLDVDIKDDIYHHASRLDLQSQLADSKPFW